MMAVNLEAKSGMSIRESIEKDDEPGVQILHQLHYKIPNQIRVKQIAMIQWKQPLIVSRVMDPIASLVIVVEEK